MMKLKKYLLYLLILVVIGAIAVSIFFALKSRQNDESAAGVTSQTTEDKAVETGIEDGEDIEAEEETVVEEEPEIFEDHYTSSSNEFAAYTLKCPEGWIITEENSGATLMISNAERLLSSIKPSSEYIMIKVEALQSFFDQQTCFYLVDTVNLLITYDRNMAIKFPI
jgi:hypothetical protein